MGNERFGRGEYAKALQVRAVPPTVTWHATHLSKPNQNCNHQVYDQAMRMLPETNKERAVLHNNKAACHLKARAFPTPSSSPALPKGKHAPRDG